MGGDLDVGLDLWIYIHTLASSRPCGKSARMRHKRGDDHDFIVCSGIEGILSIPVSIELVFGMFDITVANDRWRCRLQDCRDK